MHAFRDINHTGNILNEKYHVLINSSQSNIDRLTTIWSCLNFSVIFLTQ